MFQKTLIEKRTIFVPSDCDFSMFPINATGLNDVTIEINGTVRAS